MPLGVAALVLAPDALPIMAACCARKSFKVRTISLRGLHLAL